MPKVTELYAWLIDDGEGGEAVPFAQCEQNGQWMTVPMMGADMDRMMTDASGDQHGAQSLRTVVEQLAKQRGKPIKLVRSTGLEVIEVIQP